MSPDDPRHGTTAGYNKHRRDKEDACADCRNAQTRYNNERKYGLAGEVALTGGRWVNKGGIQVWVSDRKRKARADCGTDAGYYRHLRRTKTEPCHACKWAHSKAELARRERAREAVA